MGMYCKKCYYDLSHCKSHECPECGRFFSPDLPKTYLKKPHSPTRHARMPFRIAIMVTAVLVIAYWVSIGPQLLSAFQPSVTYIGVSMVSQHQTLRSQLTLYDNQHNGKYPTLRQMKSWDVLTMKTDIDGNTGTGPDFIYGPYMQKPPLNGYTNSDKVAAIGKATAQHGWEYDETTGNIRFVVPTLAEFNRWALDPEDAVIAKP